MNYYSNSGNTLQMLSKVTCQATAADLCKDNMYSK